MAERSAIFLFYSVQAQSYDLKKRGPRVCPGTYR